MVRALRGTVWKASWVLCSPERVPAIIDREWEFQKVWFGGLALNNWLIITAILHMACERSLEFFLSEKIILCPTTYFKPSLGWCLCAYFPPSLQATAEAKKHQSLAHFTHPVSNWMPSSEAATLSDLLYREVWHKGSWLCSVIPRGCLSSSGRGSSQPLDGAVCCPAPCSKSALLSRGI